MNKYKNQSGFTLLEILLVVAAIAILAGIVIFAINPSKQLGDTRNAQRKVDVNTILNAVHQYKLDNAGQLPGTDSGDPITSDHEEICIRGSDCEGYVNLYDLTIDAKYLTALPVDPSNTSEDGTGYFISVQDSGRITVSAPNSENNIAIEVQR